MAIKRATTYECDAPGCTVKVVADKYSALPEGWGNLTLEDPNMDMSEEEDCECVCHTCSADEEEELTGHTEDDCPCYERETKRSEWDLVLCTKHFTQAKGLFPDPEAGQEL